MISLSIFEIKDNSFESTYVWINLSWWPIVSTTCSIFGLLFGSLWIYEPVSNETNKWIGFFTFLPIFFFRLIAWQIIILITVELSLILIAAILITNVTALYSVQSSQLSIEPLTSAVLSIVLPMYKLPSSTINQAVSIKALTLLAVCGNVLLMLFLCFILTLKSYDVYNPWDSKHKCPIKFAEEWFQPVFWALLSMSGAATVPLVTLYVSTEEKFFATVRKKTR